MSRFFATLFVLLGASLAIAPMASADPVAGEQSADITIDELEAEGYNVQINWGTGSRFSAMSECAVTSIYNPNRTGEPPTTFTTVYVDVECPYDDSTRIGFGF